MNSRLPLGGTVKSVRTHDRQDYTVGLRLKVWEHELQPLHWFCRWVTVVSVGTQTATASLVLTSGLRLRVWKHEPQPSHWFVTGLRLKVWEHESQLTDQRGLPYGLRLRV